MYIFEKRLMKSNNNFTTYVHSGTNHFYFLFLVLVNMKLIVTDIQNWRKIGKVKLKN